MQNKFFIRIEQLFLCQTATEFYGHFDDLYEDFFSSSLVFEHSKPLDSSFLYHRILGIFANRECVFSHPTKIRRPNHAKTPLALAKILHSVAHIECSAIFLALDAVFRFRGLQQEFYADWLEVAKEEIYHFRLLNGLLEELGFAYGDFPVHLNLFEALYATQHSFKVRMGIVHRGLEAKGLDANPFVIRKILNSPSKLNPKIQEVFNIILRDEITHVQKGDKWWKLDTGEQTPNFLELCKQYQHFYLTGSILNKNARLQAGFSQAELKELEQMNQSKYQ
ncbi:hypothetical protein CCZ01_01595 [Helicobacter monodelphidis]|uniref:ferritin-like domain-containing protein n=1 Tax=Helicobacter sp. 15-1451 TaxID=2004995 RepID=UPI000DCBC2FE|nr:DUF455 family protein [Helicobacter sp. 15-1451]RAX58915.1 hypothetical protein CCZ01_01595 [Helicobacter sp. 15-1451]